MMAGKMRPRYSEADRFYGAHLDRYLGDTPRNIAVSHILRINPRLHRIPRYRKGYVRGFMRATIEAAREAGLEWDKLKDPNLCAYVWLRYFNKESLELYQNNEGIFSSYGEEFWRCAYLLDAIGESAFSYFWAKAAPTSATLDVYSELLYAVNSNKKQFGDVTAQQMKVLVFKECEFVFQLAKIIAGRIQSAGPGKEPIPPTADISTFFTQGKVTRGERR